MLKEGICSGLFLAAFQNGVPCYDVGPLCPIMLFLFFHAVSVLLVRLHQHTQRPSARERDSAHGITR